MLRCDFLSAFYPHSNPLEKLFLNLFFTSGFADAKIRMGLNKFVDIGGSSWVFGFQREEGNVITC